MNGKSWSGWIWTVAAGGALLGIMTVSCCGVVGWTLYNKIPAVTSAAAVDTSLASHSFWQPGLPKVAVDTIVGKLEGMGPDLYAIVYEDGMVEIKDSDHRAVFFELKDNGFLRQKTPLKHFIYHTVDQRTKPSKEAVQRKMKSLMDQAAYRGYAD